MKTMMVPCMVISIRYFSGVKSPPNSGTFMAGHARWMRMYTDKPMATNTENSASRKYWMPMTLWSLLKMYFQMKPSGWAWWAAPAACVLIASLLQPGNLSCLFAGLFVGQPLIKFGLRHHLEDGAHAVVVGAAELGAHDFVIAGHVSLKMDGDQQPGQGILLQAQLAHVKPVSHIVRTKDQFDRTAQRNAQRGRDHVVFGCGVLIIEAHWVGLADELRSALTESVVGARVAEKPVELFSGNFDHQRPRGRVGKMQLRPRFLTCKPQPHEEHQRGRAPEYLHGVVAV